MRQGPDQVNRVAIPALDRLPEPPPPGWQPCHLRGAAMGTSWSVSCHAPKGATAAIKPLIHAAIQRTIGLFSPWVADSEISRLNAAPSDRVALSADFARFLAEMLEIARISDGAFDPTLGALVDLWGFGPPGPRPADAPMPPTGRIATARAVSGWQQLALDAARGCLTRPRGMKLDFGGCAKGWAADRISEGLAGLGVASHMVEIGGEIAARGLKPDLQPWWIAIERPETAAGAPLLVALADLAMASSGDYRRCFTHAGRRFAHTIDAATGWPVANDIASATVLERNAARADALASALLVMGLPRALDFAARHDLAAVLFRRVPGGTCEYPSPAFDRMLSDATDG